MTMPTVTSLRRNRRRQGAERIIAAMKQGAALRLHYQGGRAIWSLSSGPFVPADVAAIVTANPRVVCVGDALFLGMPGQTWRYCEPQEDCK